MEEWTIEDVCTFVQGLSQEFGDHASVYAAAMKEKAIDSEMPVFISESYCKLDEEWDLCQPRSSRPDVVIP